jgi:hypothetical protein
LAKINFPLTDSIADLSPIFFSLNPEDIILRVHKRVYSPLYFSYSGPRGHFDHHNDTSQRGTLYAVPVLNSGDREAFSSCLLEYFGDVRLIPENKLNTLSICWIKINRRLTLLDLRGNGALKAGGDHGIMLSRMLSQEWSRYFYENEHLYSKIDGIIYPSTHSGMPILVLYERAEGALVVAEDIPFNHHDLRYEILSAAADFGIAVEHYASYDDNEFKFLDENIDRAVKNAQQNLLDKDISYVYSRENQLIEHNPDGSEELIRDLDIDFASHIHVNPLANVSSPDLDL